MASVNPTGGAPEPEPEPRRGRKVPCGYCGTLTDSEGEIITMGKRANQLRAISENEDTRIKRISDLEAEVADLKAKLAARVPEPEPAPKRKSVLDSVLGG